MNDIIQEQENLNMIQQHLKRQGQRFDLLWLF